MQVLKAPTVDYMVEGAFGRDFVAKHLAEDSEPPAVKTIA